MPARATNFFNNFLIKGLLNEKITVSTVLKNTPQLCLAKEGFKLFAMRHGSY
jgi:hypothetical protein